VNNELRNATLRTVCIDFDGVLYDYQGWVEPPSYLPERPVPGAVEFCHLAVQHFKVVVCSARFKYEGVLESAYTWLFNYGFPAGEMVLTYEKPLAFIYIDDRGWTFKGLFPTMSELNSFMTWQEKLKLQK